MIHSLLSNSLQGIDADGVLDSLTGLESSDMMGILDDLMNPIKIHLHYTEKTDSDSDKIIKDIIKTIFWIFLLNRFCDMWSCNNTS